MINGGQEGTLKEQHHYHTACLLFFCQDNLGGFPLFLHMPFYHKNSLLLNMLYNVFINNNAAVLWPSTVFYMLCFFVHGVIIETIPYITHQYFDSVQLNICYLGSDDFNFLFLNCHFVH